MIGRALDDFRIIKLIGQGGIGKVFLATQESLDREVVIKVIDVAPSQSDSKVVARFMREAKLMASINHPNIVSIYKVGTTDDINYIAMEYIDGMQLDDFFKHKQFGKLKEKMVWEIFRGIVNGLQIALQHGIIHRDIKPGNILIGNNYIPKITDFGISKQLDQDMGLTFEGTILGSPSYISPEQASGENVFYHSDMYSLGASIYQILTGEPLFPGTGLIEVLHKQISSQPLAPRTHVKGLRDETVFILGKLLHKKAEERYLSYGDLLTDITLLLEHKPLIYAGYDDAVTVFDYAGKKPKLRHKSHFFTKLLSRSYLTLPKAASPDILWVANNISTPETILQRAFRVHYINSVVEFNFALEQHDYLVIFDMNYLDSDLIKYLNFLSCNYPKTKCLIISSEQPKNNTAKKLFTKVDNIQDLVDILEHQQKNIIKAEEITFKNILALIAHFKWSITLKIIEKNSSNSGYFTFEYGKPQKNRQDHIPTDTHSFYCWNIVRDDLPQDWELSNSDKVIGKTETDCSNNKHHKSVTLALPKLTGDIKDIGNNTPITHPQDDSTIKLKSSDDNTNKRATDEQFEKMRLRNNISDASGQQQVNQAQPSAAAKTDKVFLKLIDDSGKQSERISSAAGSIEPISDKKSETSAPQDITQRKRKHESLIAELEQTWELVLSKRSVKQNKASEEKRKRILAEKINQNDRHTQFMELMDKAIDLSLQKNYDRAYEILLEAKKINPNAPILKMNIKRLEAMGYGKTGDKK